MKRDCSALKRKHATCLNVFQSGAGWLDPRRTAVRCSMRMGEHPCGTCGVPSESESSCGFQDGWNTGTPGTRRSERPQDDAFLRCYLAAWEAVDGSTVNQSFTEGVSSSRQQGPFVGIRTFSIHFRRDSVTTVRHTVSDHSVNRAFDASAWIGRRSIERVALTRSAGCARNCPSLLFLKVALDG